VSIPRIGDADCWDTRRELVGEPIASTRHGAESGLPSSRGVFRNQCSCKGIQREGEKVMSTPGIPVELDFRTRAKTNDVPVARLIGFEAKEIAEGRATVTLSAGPQHANPMGTLHGGILCDIADAAMGMAFASTLAPKESFTTVELKINSSVPSGRLTSRPREKLCAAGRAWATSSARSRTNATGSLPRQRRLASC